MFAWWVTVGACFNSAWCKQNATLATTQGGGGVILDSHVVKKKFENWPSGSVSHANRPYKCKIKAKPRGYKQRSNHAAVSTQLGYL